MTLDSIFRFLDDDDGCDGEENIKVVSESFQYTIQTRFFVIVLSSPTVRLIRLPRVGRSALRSTSRSGEDGRDKSMTGSDTGDEWER